MWSGRPVESSAKTRTKSGCIIISPNLKKLTYTLLQRKKEFYCDAESNAIDKLERFRLSRRVVDK